MGKYIYGIDVGGTTVKIGLFSSAGKVLKKWEISTNKEKNGKYIIGDIYNAILKQKIPFKDIIGYGFGVPGPVVSGVIVECVNLGWKNFDLKAEFALLTGNDNIYIENDANVAVLGETWKGAAVGYKNSAMITIGTGIGCGLVVNGMVFSGADGAAGELGHLRVIHENGIPCKCGGKGCFETVASATGIKNVFAEMMNDTDIPSKLRGMTGVSVKKIFDHAKEGDALCLAVVDKISYHLSYACHVISVTTNPNIILIGGGVSKAGKFFIDKIKAHFDEFHYIPVKDTIIALASLGNDAGIYGAASLVIYD